jgi:hypothetical protein
MKKLNLIWIIGMILLVGTAFAEVQSRSNSYLDEEDNTWTQHTLFEYPDDDIASISHLIVKVRISCEDLEAFNTANENNQIYNVSLKTIYTEYYSSNSSYETIEANYGCTDGSSSCDTTNTPATLDFEYKFKEGEDLQLMLVTYFNESNATTGGAVYDSICRYDMSFDSRNCEDCGDVTFEEVTTQLENQQVTFDTKSSIISMFNSLVGYNFMIWAIISYIVKIGGLIFAIVGMIYTIFWLYLFFKREFGGGRT